MVRSTATGWIATATNLNCQADSQRTSEHIAVMEGDMSELSTTMRAAIDHAQRNGSKLIRYPGGFWAQSSC